MTQANHQAPPVLGGSLAEWTIPHHKRAPPPRVLRPHALREDSPAQHRRDRWRSGQRSPSAARYAPTPRGEAPADATLPRNGCSFCRPIHQGREAATASPSARETARSQAAEKAAEGAGETPWWSKQISPPM